MPKRIPFSKGAFSSIDTKAQERRRFYNGQRWIRIRARFLAAHPVCNTEGCNHLSSIAHHKIDRLKASHLAYSWDNLEALCKSCHDRLTRQRMNGSSQ
jgi:5-methylcytosine-specific restriction endonuclease McrA